MYRFTFASSALAVALFLEPHFAWAVPVPEQEATPSPQVSQILDSLSPAERVGQLFITTFKGTSVDEGSPIHTLITRHRIGGVVLSAAHDNFDDRDDVLQSARALTEGLQRTAFQASQSPPTDLVVTPTWTASTYLPLLIGVSHEGNGAPYTDLLGGVTALPSAMAVGATWSREVAQLVGEMAGSELSQLGINLLLGPTLDVLQKPWSANPGDPGVRAFGGDAYWVSELGRAYIAGVHTGSDGRLAVVALPFPGLGTSDRAIEMDIPTVNKSIGESRAVDLAPFLTVVSANQDMLGSADGLMPSHARYVAWQGTLSTTTRPLSLDAPALGELMKLPELAAWRTQGGIILSSPLGRRGVRRFYDPKGVTFPAFEIARDALLAGNDLLFTDEFGLNPSQDQFDTISETLERFVQKYQEDLAFSERVDQAASRIIGLKLGLYGRITLGNVLPTGDLDLLGTRAADVFDIAQQAVTLISPSPAELANRLPRPPARLENIVFLTDMRLSQQCGVCRAINTPSVDALQQAVIRLYGIAGSAQIRSVALSSFSFSELNAHLSGVVPSPTPTPEIEATATAEEGETAVAVTTAAPSEGTAEATPVPELTIGDALRSAEWVVFALRDVSPDAPEGNALRRFLAERPDLVAGRKIVVFALGAPYHLDATEVAQVTAYYVLYSHIPPFLEVAARILFQEIAPHRASPVSVDAASYNLEKQISPDPDQIFRLFREIPESGQEATPGPSPAVTLTTTPMGTVSILTAVAPEVPEGTTVTLATSPLLDRNGHLVPDGTGVEFEASYLAQGGLTEIFVKPKTVGGVARATLVLDRTGLIEIRAHSGGAVSEPIQINVSLVEGQPTIVVQTVTPLPTATATPAVTATPMPPTVTPTPSPQVMPTPLLASTPLPPLPPPPPHVDPWDLLSGVLAMVVLGSAGWGWSRSRGRSTASGIKFILRVTIGVWLGYNYYALNLPGTAAFRSLGALAPTLFAWGGGLIALGVERFWPVRDKRKEREFPLNGGKGGDDG